MSADKRPVGRESRPRVQIVAGPPRAVNEIGIWPPMMMRESRAWCDHVDQIRRTHYEKLVASFKIRS